MGPTRFPYGQALGFQNQFSFTNGPVTSGTAGNISGTATPNVTLGNLFYVNNTGSLQITSFVLDDTANRITSYEGKTFRVFVLDTGSTSFANAGNLFLSGTDNLAGQNNTIEFMFSRGNFFELNRSYITRNGVSTVLMGANSSANVDGVSLLILNNTGSVTTPLFALSGGQVGQEVNVIASGSNANTILSGGNIFQAITNATLVNASGMYKLIKVNATSWRLQAVGSGSTLG